MHEILKFRELAPYTGGRTKATIYRWIRLGHFPRPVSTGPVSATGTPSVGWLRNEVEQWQGQRIADRDRRPAHELRQAAR